jgi:sialic acid synthase SpsE
MDNSETESLDAIKTVLAAAIEHGRERGRREGMIEAAAMCEAKAVLHQTYLPPGFHYKDGDFDQAATCGRRDECKNLAYEIRNAAIRPAVVKEATA